jgi:hypothetical protein
MKAPPVLLLGGRSPVVAYRSDSMMVYMLSVASFTQTLAQRTVFPEPFQPTMSVSGVVKTIVSPFSGPKERMPWIIMRSILDMAAAEGEHSLAGWLRLACAAAQSRLVVRVSEAARRCLG